MMCAIFFYLWNVEGLHEMTKFVTVEPENVLITKY